ncbi:hypothetical protein [Halobellus salinisoli]|uniref:hypothetical protein n=1 Tax=Halobellus salinisoli TaxID=3108500 RepID=UPI003008A9A4
MQRRAAAIYVALFIVIGAASYSLIATAQTPTVEFDNPEYELAQGDQFQVGDRAYTVSSVSETTGELQYTEESSEYTATWENDSTQTVDDEEWRVLVDEGEEPSGFTLEEEINETAILQEDPDASEETVEQNGTRYVVINESELVPADEYFPEPETRSYAEGDSFQYEGNETTVDSVTADAVQLTWTAPRTNTITAEQEVNVTLGDETYLAYFPDGSTMQLTQDFESYDRQTAEIDRVQTQTNGLWGVSILSFLTSVFMIGFAYLPSRY